MIINELVCEGCGDCGVQSNCVSVQPVETEFGRKRKIDQSNCNKDFSCINGLLPVASSPCMARKLTQGRRRRRRHEAAARRCPSPRCRARRPVGIVVTGVGGTGVVTIGAILGMAAHLEGKGCGMIDMAGLAQKGGAVFSHVRIASTPEDIHAIRVSAGKADLVLGCDLVVSGAKKVLARSGRTTRSSSPTRPRSCPATSPASADFSLPVERLKKAIREAAGDERAHFFDATRSPRRCPATRSAPTCSCSASPFRHGGLPLSSEAVEKAIELNGQAVKMNVAAFGWGRRAPMSRSSCAG